MALQFWLPLTKDTRNQGLTSCTVSNGGASYSSTGGKLGGCYTFSNTPLYGDWSDINSLTKFSACMWVYLTTTSSALYFIHCGGTGSWTSKVSLDYEGGIRSQINGSEYISGLTLSTNTWYHLAMTWDGSTLSWYINGEFKKSVSAAGSFSASNHFAIGARTAASDGKTFAYPITSAGRLNDVRLYDSCLSSQEVKRISLGLVGGWLGNELWSRANLISQCTTSLNGWSGSFTDMTDGTYKLVANNGWHVIKWKLPSSYSGKTITISGRAKLISSETTSTAYSSLWYTNATGTNPYRTGDFDGNTEVSNALPTKDKWYYFYKTVTLNTDYQIGIGSYCDPENNNLQTTWLLLNIKIEEGDTPSIYRADSAVGPVHDALSGLHNDLTVNGTVSLSSDTKRYDRSTVFPSNTTGYLQLAKSAIAHFYTNKILTLSLWFKPTTTNARKMILGEVGSYLNNIEINSSSDNSIRFYWNNTEWSPGVTCPVNTWTHLAFVITASSVLIYKNGALAASHSSCSWGSAPTGDWLFGSDLRTGTYFLGGCLSDIRLYATALSSDDVLELYKLGV